MAEKKVRVLIIDDSSFIRTILRSALSQHPQIEVVGFAKDGVEGLEQIAALRPDVATLDVEMPRLNGIGVLERAAGKVPVGFVMVSTLTQAGAQITFEALRKGAIDYIGKPQSGGIASVPEFRRQLQEKVLAAAKSKGKVKRFLSSGASAASAAPKLPPNKERGWVVAIGISCGGPQTLYSMLPTFPSDFVPILITQHMPEQFTRSFASQLDKLCALQVREAAEGDALAHGTVYIAPGSHHLRLARRGVNLVVRLDPGPKVTGHRPSADVMFGSVAKTCGPRSVGVVMTGMGSDGAAGIVQMKIMGARTIAQDRETSLVFGMPKVAAETGKIDRVVALPQIPQTISQMICSQKTVTATAG